MEQNWGFGMVLGLLTVFSNCLTSYYLLLKGKNNYEFEISSLEIQKQLRCLLRDLYIMTLGQGIEVKNKLLENISEIPARKNSAMMDICAAHEAKTKSPKFRSRSNSTQWHNKEVPENPARKNCCLYLGRTTLEASLLVSITVNIIFFWYTIWNLLKNTC